MQQVTGSKFPLKKKKKKRHRQLVHSACSELPVPNSVVLHDNKVVRKDRHLSIGLPSYLSG